MHTPRNLAALFFLFLLAVTGVLEYPQYTVERRAAAQLAAILSSDTATTTLPARTKTTGCEVRGPLPDPECTPGAVFSDKTLEEICVPGYTKTVRDVSEKTKRIVYLQYGITTYPQPRGTYEVDHLIPLAIGGSNDIANLFPEAAEPAPGFKEKDLVEVYLRREVCAGRVDIAIAQKQIATDWLAIYHNLSAADIASLKQMYRNWSN